MAKRVFNIELTIPDDSVFGDDDVRYWLDVCCEYGFQTTDMDEYTNHEWKITEV